jgi:hypothetical protein
MILLDVFLLSTMPPSIFIAQAQEDTWKALALTPTPSIEPAPTPTTTVESQLPSTLEIVIIVIAVVFALGLVVNLIKKRKKPR